MKISYFLLFAFYAAFIAISCNNSKDGAAEQTTTTDSITAIQDPNAVQTLTAGGNEKHFMCPKKCEGSGGDAKGTCPVCGSEYVHNQAYHNQAPAGEGTAANPIQIDPSAGPTTGVTTPADQQVVTNTQPAAAKNAKGEWHFNCAKACGGGAGEKGVCPKCGAELVHNQAFHAQ